MQPVTYSQPSRAILFAVPAAVATVVALITYLILY